ncbi:cobalamin biosynthesis protein CobQ [uncultured Roseobacter sp.]|uniref:cobalamin biosynthesis protein CobQ n=2 Tax=uncultured Roseobacter sp. TaxID=114847 RepID=UPI00261B7C71|nr:cobalamin biosynthesis protein CobQ [uncultured Roseobacter sp.]
MNTPAHLLIGAAVMGRKGNLTVVGAAMIGALLPDLSLYLLAGSALYVFGIPPQIVFDELYFSEAWQTIFAIDNSFVVWGCLFALGLWRGVPWAVALTGAALLHLCLDFPLHHDDGRAHFWPLSGWIFESPLSYWDRDHGAMWLAPIEAFLATLAALALWQRRFGWGMLMLVTALLVMEIWVVRQWLFFFTDS